MPSRSTTLFALSLALFGGSVGFEDLKGLSVLAIGFAGVLTGFTHPRGAWRWGIVLVACFSAAQLLLWLVHSENERPPVRSSGDIAALAIFVGTYIGVSLERVVAVLERPTD